MDWMYALTRAQVMANQPLQASLPVSPGAVLARPLYSDGNFVMEPPLQTSGWAQADSSAFFRLTEARLTSGYSGGAGAGAGPDIGQPSSDASVSSFEHRSVLSEHRSEFGDAEEHLSDSDHGSVQREASPAPAELTELEQLLLKVQAARRELKSESIGLVRGRVHD